MTSLMKFLGDSWTLAAKDLLCYSRDRSALILGFLVPIVLVTVFGTIMTYAFGSSGMPKVKLWVVDEDQTETSQALVEQLRTNEMLSIYPKTAEKRLTSEDLAKRVKDGDVHHGLVIPKGYGDALADGKQLDLRMLRDPGRKMEDRVIQFAMAQSLMTQSGNKLWKDSIHRIFEKQGMDPGQLERLDRSFADANRAIEDFLRRTDKPSTDNAGVQQGDTAQSPETPTQRDIASDVFGNLVPLQQEDIQPPSRPRIVTHQQSQSVSGMGVMMLLFGLSGAGAVLLSKREQGTLRRLLGLPVQRETILFGKFIYLFLIGIVQMFVLFLYGEFIFRVGLFRNVPTTTFMILSWTAAATSFAMAIATFSRSTKQGDGLATILILAMSALGGCWFPVQMLELPLPLEIVSKSTMTYWAMEGFQGMLWNGLNWNSPKILRAMAFLAVWTTCLAGLSVFLFRRNYIST